jgi:hypothetical protein
MCASVVLTITSCRAVDPSSNIRPARSGIPITEKYAAPIAVMPVAVGASLGARRVDVSKVAIAPPPPVTMVARSTAGMRMARCRIAPAFPVAAEGPPWFRRNVMLYNRLASKPSCLRSRS